LFLEYVTALSHARVMATPSDALSPGMVRVRVIEDLAGDWRRLDERVESLSDEIEAVARHDAGCGGERASRGHHSKAVADRLSRGIAIQRTAPNPLSGAGMTRAIHAQISFGR